MTRPSPPRSASPDGGESNWTGRLPGRRRERRTGSEAYFVYILECTDGTFYTGWTTDVARRLKAHNAGRGARYTQTRRPVRLVYSERLPTRAAAMRREWAIKRGSRARKLLLVQSGAPRQ